jgi:outer membrane protein TolC
MNKIILLSALFLIYRPIYTQNDTAVTLNYCIEAALRNNPAIKSLAGESAIAGLAVKTARSGRYASINDEASAGFSELYKSGNDYNTGFAGLSVNQLIWQNNRIDAAIDKARFSRNSTSAYNESLKQDIILSVKLAFIACSRESLLYTTAQENVTRSAMFLEYAKNRYAVGIGKKSDLLKAESDLITSKFECNGILNSLKQNRYELTMLTGLKTGDLEHLSDVYDVDKPDMYSYSGIDSLANAAMALYPELIAIKYTGLAQQAAVREIKASFYPALLINAGYERSYSPLAGEQKGVYSLLTLKWDIFSGFEKRNRMQSAIIKKQVIDLRAEEIRNTLIKEINNRLIDLNEGLDQINMMQSLMITTSENLESAKAQYQSGTASMLELTDARITDLIAKQNNIKAIARYRMAMANLERLIVKSNENETN